MNDAKLRYKKQRKDTQFDPDAAAIVFEEDGFSLYVPDTDPCQWVPNHVARAVSIATLLIEDELPTLMRERWKVLAEQHGEPDDA